MAQISKALSEYKFKSPAMDSDRWNAIRAAMMNGKRLKNVCMMPSMTLSVRMYVGGIVRCLAFFRTDYHAACRMADLLVYRLGARRFRYSHLPKANDYNYNEAQAKRDWELETELHPIFERLENHLESLGALTAIGEYVRKPTGEIVIELAEEVRRISAELKVLAEAVTKLYEKTSTKA